MSKLCFGCMQQKESSPVCEHCGYDENTGNLPHQLPLGTLLNNQYLIGKVLGQGGFGITYMGWDQHLSTPVAIKEYFPSGVVHRHAQLGSDVICDSAETPEVFARHRDRFLKEARTLAQLSDIPEIVQIRSYFSANNTAYIVMEYVDGITLKEHLKRLGRPMTESETLAIMEPVLKALQKVHAQHLIHRDISPDNIMLPTKGGIKLIDFGTVGYTDNSGKSKSTGTILKPGFAPAEQYNSRANLGTWTDVYAVSASCHYLLTGKVPADVHERMDLGEQLTELRANPHISQVLINALENGMKIRSSDRIQTVEELYCQLYTKRTAPKVHKLRKATIALAAAGACILAACFLPLTRSANVPETALAEENTTAHVLFDTQESAYQQACTLMEQELYEEAMAIFAQLGDYKDCAIRFEQCQQQTVLQQQYEEASAMAEQGQLGKAAIAFAKLGTYRDAKSRSLALWKQMPGRVTISFWNGGSDMMLHALRADGTIAVDTLDSDSVSEEYLEKYFTAGYTDIVSIHGPIGLRYDGTLALPSAGSQYRELEGWSDIVALSVRYCDFPGNTYVGLKSDGTVVAAGYSEDGQCDVEGWTDIVAVSCGQGYTVGLKADGTLVTAGHNEYGQCNVQDWKNIVDISTATNAHVTYGLTADGRVLTAGVNQWDDVVKVSRWKNIRAIYDNCGICDDGTMVSTAIDSRKLSAYNDMAAMIYMNKMPVCLRMNGTLVFLDLQEGQFARARTWQDIQIPAFPITDF